MEREWGAERNSDRQFNKNIHMVKSRHRVWGCDSDEMKCASMVTAAAVGYTCGVITAVALSKFFE